MSDRRGAELVISLGVLLLQACALDWTVTTNASAPVVHADAAERDGGSAAPTLDDHSAERTVAPGRHPSSVESDAGDATDATDDGADAGDAGDGGGCGASNCDCDGDGFDDLSKPGCAGSGGEDDCDDDDPLVRPDQTFLDVASPPRGGDWDCSNVVEEAYPSGVSCGGLALGACAGVEGFTGDPACGASGTYVTCGVKDLLFCAAVTTTQKRQACK